MATKCFVTSSTSRLEMRTVWSSTNTPRWSHSGRSR
jgi:hypothetical protein